MDKCDKNIEKLKIENEEKDREIAKKKQQLLILQEKEKRIVKQKQAVQKYQKFLEEVQRLNSDEFNEIGDILSRHTVLQNTSSDLLNKLRELEDKLNNKREEVNKYNTEMGASILTLNNDIAKLTTENEKVENARQKLATQEEETSFKARGKISGLSRLFMAIDNLDRLCSDR